MLVVFFSCVGFVFAQFTPYKAKDNLSTANNAMSARASDAILYGVATTDSVQMNGTAGLWVYLYFSQTKDSTYGVSFIYGTAYIIAYSVSSGKTYSSIGSSWINSDAAISVAEANGGSAFRNAHPNPLVYMDVQKGIYPADQTRIVWLVTYQSGSSDLLYVYIDAITGAFLTSGTSGISDPVATPAAVQLQQNYPNPFNTSTNISFALSAPQTVTLAVYDQLGRQVATLLNGRADAGQHSVSFDAGNLPKGVYFVRLAAGGAIQMQEMTVVK